MLIKRILGIEEEKLSMTLFSCGVVLIASGILAFGLYNVHSFSGVTEGGVLGMTLLLENIFSISPSLSGLILNVICYLMGWKLLGRRFLFYSGVSSLGFSLFYRICESFDPLFPQLADMPLTSAIIGALFVGVGAGLCVKAGGASGGDDALAMSISHLTKIKIQWVYLLTDFTVLGLSICYIPLSKLVYSVITVLLSGQIIGLIQKINFITIRVHEQNS